MIHVCEAIFLDCQKSMSISYLMQCSRVQQGPAAPWGHGGYERGGSPGEGRAGQGNQGLSHLPSQKQGRLGGSSSPETWASPWGWAQAGFRLGCQSAGGGQDKTWWGEPGWDTALRWPSRAMGMWMRWDWDGGQDAGLGPGQVRAWMRSAQAETMPDSIALNLFLS